MEPYYAGRVRKEEILVAFSAPDTGALGNIWRITAKNTDFYLDPLGQKGVFHLSAHGPKGQTGSGHRFHVKVDREGAKEAEGRGDFLLHSLPRKGHVVDGQELAPSVFRVARIRWVWDLQRPRYRRFATSGALPEVTDDQSGARLSKLLGPNEAADVDLVISYNEPYWPAGPKSLQDNARLGPLRNDSGMWLTATSYRRSQAKYPSPDGLALPLPKPGDEPNRIMSGGPGEAETAGLYWFMESITSRQLLEDSRPATTSTAV
jgi:hypothetical protein